MRRLGSWVGGVLLSGTLWKLFLFTLPISGTEGRLHFIWPPHMVTGQSSQFAGMSEDGPSVPVSLDLCLLFSGLFAQRYLEYLVCALTFKMYVRCFVRFQRHVTSIHVSINPSFSKCF